MSLKRFSILGSGGILPLMLLACSSRPSGEPSQGTVPDSRSERVDHPAPTDDPAPERVPLVLSKDHLWKNKLEKPAVYVYTPDSDDKGALRVYKVGVRIDEAQMLPPGPPSNFPKTKVFAYGGKVTRDGGATSTIEYTSPGATFEMERNVRARVEWANEIEDAHLFTVDSSPHVPLLVHTKPPYVTHLHGLEVAPAFDGHPEGWFTATAGVNGKEFKGGVYQYPNSQPPTTLWYHDHTIGMTRLNVYAGLAGLYLIRDPNDKVEKNAAWLPTGAYEMPLVIQDRSFYDDGSLNYAGGIGDTNVVNGKVWPAMEVEPRRYRFRILNGANQRFYDLALSNGRKLTVIGSDGGYLEKPTPVNTVLLSPGERADVLLDFSGLPAGETVTLRNHAPAFYPLGDDPTTVGDLTGEVVRFTVRGAAAQDPPLPSELHAIPKLPSGGLKRTLTLHDGDDGTSLIDGQPFHGAVSETPRLGTTEDWDIVNLTTLSHPMHVHLVQFQVLGREKLDATAYETKWREENANATTPLSKPTVKVPVDDFVSRGSFTGPLPAEAGWKDTVVVNPGEVTRIRVRWAPQESKADGSADAFTFDPTAAPGYVWHCHNLEHEDGDMMRPLKIE